MSTLDKERRTADFAESQIRSLLVELLNSSHNSKVKAIKLFQSYLEKYNPDIYDDDIDYLYTGSTGGMVGYGLLYWCGASSENHEGQLKRICGPSISLVRWLLDFKSSTGDRLFYERFVSLPVTELVKMNFMTHILQDNGSGSSSSDARNGSSNDAMALLSCIIQDHRNLDGEVDEVDVNAVFFNHDNACLEKFTQWCHQSAAVSMNKVMDKSLQAAADDTKGTGTDAIIVAANESNSTASVAIIPVAPVIKPKKKEADLRPKVWMDALKTFRVIPVQEGELGATDDDDDTGKVVQLPPISDPLGLSALDLRVTQEMHATGKLGKSSGSVMDGGMRAIQLLQQNQHDGSRKKAAADVDRNDTDTDDDDDEAMLNDYSSGSSKKENLKSAMDSIIPHDKNFSPSLFMSIVHGNTPMSKLKTGLSNLNQQLQQRTGQRENLVRTHFGMFVHCIEGLEWLKAYRVGLQKKVEERSVTSFESPSAKSKNKTKEAKLLGNAGKDNGEKRLMRACASLDRAKKEAQLTLAPILDRMQKSKKLRMADQVLRRLASTLEYPNKMQTSIAKGDYEDAVTSYHRVKAMPSTNSLNILKKVTEMSDVLASTIRTLCIDKLVQPTHSKGDLIRYSNILLSLDGTYSYMEYLYMSFTKQLEYLSVKLTHIHDVFVLQCQAYYTHGTYAGIVDGADVEVQDSSDVDDTNHTYDDDDDDDVTSRYADDETKDAHDEFTLFVFNNVSSSGIGNDSTGPGNTDGPDDAIYALRVKKINRITDTIEMALPCLHTLTSVLAKSSSDSDANTKTGSTSSVSSSTNKATVDKNVRVFKDGSKASRKLASTLANVSQVVHQLVNGYNDSSNASEEMQMLMEHDGIKAELSSSYRDHALQEISDIYAIMEHILILNDTYTSSSSSSVSKVENPYKAALSVYQSLAIDGEVTSTRCVIDRLSMYCSNRWSSSSSRSGTQVTRNAMSNSNASSSIGMPNYFMHASSIVQNIRSSGNTMGTSSLSSENSSSSSSSSSSTTEQGYMPLRTESVSLELQSTLMKALQKLSDTSKRKAWICSTVFVGMQRIVSAHIGNMRLELEDVTKLGGDSNSNSSSSRSHADSSRDISDLLELEKCLRAVGMTKTIDATLCYLDIVRSCVLLRSCLIKNVWVHATSLFDVDDESDSNASIESIISATSHANIDRRNSTTTATATGTAAGGGHKSVKASLHDRISAASHGYNSASIGIAHYPKANLNDCIALEEAMVQKYISSRIKSIDSILMTGIAVNIRNELSNRSCRRHFPPHLSKVLLLLLDENERLRHIFGDITIEGGFNTSAATTIASSVDGSGSTSTSSHYLDEKTIVHERYSTYIFRHICCGVTDSYATIISLIKSNTFPIIAKYTTATISSQVYAQTCDEFACCSILLSNFNIAASTSKDGNDRGINHNTTELLKGCSKLSAIISHIK